MMKFKLSSLLVSTVVLANLSACGYVRNWFPDKEKDYQYTTEIPPLTLPNDLGKRDILDVHADLAASSPDSSPQTAPVENSLPAAPSSDAGVAVPALEPVVPVENEASSESAEDIPLESVESTVPSANKSTAKRESIPVKLVKSENQNSLLQIQASLDMAWRIVNKALSRKSIEVTRRNQEEKLIVVQYDPGEQTVKDDSLWDEAVFIFSGLPGNEKEYVLKLTENNQQTDVTILDEKRQPASDSGSLKLLNLLQETITTDFAK
ncbi:MAG: outer membrane protein assembly factor BamC [Methylococcaceae bacterium]